MLFWNLRATKSGLRGAASSPHLSADCCSLFICLSSLWSVIRMVLGWALSEVDSEKEFEWTWFIFGGRSLGKCVGWKESESLQEAEEPLLLWVHGARSSLTVSGRLCQTHYRAPSTPTRAEKLGSLSPAPVLLWLRAVPPSKVKRAPHSTQRPLVVMGENSGMLAARHWCLPQGP